MILFLNLYVIIQIFFVNAYPVDVLYIYTHQIAYKSFFYIIVYTFHVSANHYDKSSF